MKTFISNIRILVKNNIANILTFTNLSLGCVAIFIGTHKHYFAATIAIIIATLVDRFDGKIARKLGCETKFGEELDSLSDLVSFGVAPAFLIWSLKLSSLKIGIAIAILYVLAGAFRLARFNCTEDRDVYQGVPITIAGLIMAIMSLLIMNYKANVYIIAILTIILSYCMVSTKIKIVKR